MRKLDFIGTVCSNQGEFSQTMVIPGRGGLVLSPTDWPLELSPGTLNIQANDDGFPAGFDEIGEGDGLIKFDKGKFKSEFAIPPWRITGNTLQPTPEEPLRGSAQLWLAELQVISTDQVASCWMLRRLGSMITSQIELVAQDHLRTRLNLCDGTAVKVTVWKAATRFRFNTPDEMIADWCNAARNVEGPFGEETAMGYLIGEKFLNFLEVAEKDAEWRDAIPAFVTEIKSVFEAWKIAQFLETPRRLGVLGHTMDDEGHRMLRESMDESEKLEEDARHLMLFEWAKELLLEENEP